MASSSTTTPGVWSRLVVRNRTPIRDWSTLTTLLPRPFLSRRYMLVWKVRERRSSLGIFYLFGLVSSSRRLPTPLPFFPAMSSSIHHLFISFPSSSPPPSPFPSVSLPLPPSIHLPTNSLSHKKQKGWIKSHQTLSSTSPSLLSVHQSHNPPLFLRSGPPYPALSIPLVQLLRRSRRPAFSRVLAFSSSRRHHP